MTVETKVIIAIIVLVVSVLFLIGFTWYYARQIRPLGDKLDGFTKIIVALCFIAMVFEVTSCVMATMYQVLEEDLDSTEEHPVLRDSRIGVLMASSVAYSLVFDVYVFRMLASLATSKQVSVLLTKNSETHMTLGAVDNHKVVIRSYKRLLGIFVAVYVALQIVSFSLALKANFPE